MYTPWYMRTRSQNHSLSQFSVFDSDVTSHTPAFSVGGYIQSKCGVGCGELVSANTVGHYHSGISIHVYHHLVIWLFGLVYHRYVCMNNLPGANLFFNEMNLFWHVSSPCQLAVDIFPCVITLELWNLTWNCGNWQIQLWMVAFERAYLFNLS